MFTDPKENLEHLNLQTGAYVADIGSGSGFYTILAAKEVGENGRVFSIDIQEELVSKIKKDAQTQGIFNVEAIWGDAEEIGGTKLRKDSIDAAIVSNVLFQSENKSLFIKEVKRILKDKGKVLLIEWSDSFGGLGPPKENILNQDQAIKDFEDQGFEVKEKFDTGEHHYGVVFLNSKNIKDE